MSRPTITTDSETDNESVILQMPTGEYSSRLKVAFHMFVSMFILLPLVSIDIYMLFTTRTCLAIATTQLGISIFQWMIVCVILGITCALFQLIMCAQVLLQRNASKYKGCRIGIIILYLLWTVFGAVVTWYYRITNGMCDKIVMYMYLHILGNMMFSILQANLLRKY